MCGCRIRYLSLAIDSVYLFDLPKRVLGQRQYVSAKSKSHKTLGRSVHTRIISCRVVELVSPYGHSTKGNILTLWSVTRDKCLELRLIPRKWACSTFQATVQS